MQETVELQETRAASATRAEPETLGTMVRVGLGERRVERATRGRRETLARPVEQVVVAARRVAPLIMHCPPALPAVRAIPATRA